MADFPALPLWTDAYLADTGHLSDVEHGRYFRLLMAMWRAPDCRIPNDDQWLSRKFSRSVEDVVAQLRPLITEFCQCDGNWITQKRLLKEMAFVQRTSKKQSGRSKKRWEKEKERSRGNATSGNAPTPTPTPTPLLESPHTPPRGDLGFDQFWQAYPEKVGKPVAKTAFAKAIKRATLAEILAGLERYKATKPPDRSWLNPSTFLNQERWNDQPAKVNGNGHAGGQLPLGRPERRTLNAPSVNTPEEAAMNKRMGIT
jgi:uncharacterized protein YdaU (DUF1376 family)